MDIIVHIKRLPRRSKPGLYAWSMEVDGVGASGGDGLESIQACLVDMASGLSDMTAQIRLVYRDVQVGSFSAGACLDIPAEIADRIVEKHSLVVEARM